MSRYTIQIIESSARILFISVIDNKSGRAVEPGFSCQKPRRYSEEPERFFTSESYIKFKKILRTYKCRDVRTNSRDILDLVVELSMSED